MTSRKRTREELTGERLREVLECDPKSGIFRWKVSPNNFVKVGSVAGSINPVEGYLQIQIDGNKYRAHRLVWLYVHGTWPTRLLDHVDTIRHHDWIDNLRLATKSQNNSNSNIRKTSTSPYKGITRCGRRWAAQIAFDGRKIHIGVYATPEDAHAAYVARAKDLFGEFANPG